MPLLPIVERELRVASRHSRTWWRRVLTFGAASVLFALMYMTFSRWNSIARMGKELFTFFSGFAMLYALSAGPFAATDCISRERREQTLGLLFLTRLKSWDVVLGKLSAASLDLVYGLIAIIPLLTVPILFGGVSLEQFSKVVLSVVVVLFMSLAAGIAFSSMFSSGRAALGATILALAMLFLGLPYFWSEVVGITSSHPITPFLDMWSPLHLMEVTLNDTNRRPAWSYWSTVGGHAALGVLGIVLASVLTWRAWRDLPGLSLSGRWIARLEKWKQRLERGRVGWRSVLERNPILWLEGRDFAQQDILWGLALLCGVFIGIQHLLNPSGWPDNDLLYLWPAFSHYVFCIWLAIQAPRRLADDKASGALELLLCTPLRPAGILSGIMLAFTRRFGRALVVLMTLDLFLVFAHYNARDNWDAFFQDDFYLLCPVCIVAFPLQACSIAVMGAYLGLAWGNSARATLTTLLWLGFIPWVSFFLVVLTLELARSLWGFPARFTDEFALMIWAGTHYLICGGFLIRARSQLWGNFQQLATQPKAESCWAVVWNRIGRKLKA